MKSEFYIDRVDKESCKNLLYNYHYLKDESKDFKSGYNYGLFKHTDWECPLRIGGCLGVCIFTGPPSSRDSKGAFGLERDQQEGLFELSRLCVDPDLKEEYNITSWFVLVAVLGGSGKMQMFGLFLVMLTLLTIAESFTVRAILHTMG